MPQSWQDAPIVQGGWQSAPLAEQPQQQPQVSVPKSIQGDGFTDSRGGWGDRYKSLMGGVNNIASLGFDSELGAASRAAGESVANLIKGKPVDWSNAYDKYYQQEQNKTLYDEANHPNYRTAGQVGGSFMGGAANSLKGALLQGGIEGGLYGAGEAEGGLKNRLESGGVGAATGLLTTGIFRGIGSGLKSAGDYVRKSKVIESAPTTETLKKASNKLYTAARKFGVGFNGYDDFADTLTKRMVNEGVEPVLAAKANAVLNEAAKLKGGKVSFDDIERLRRMAGNAASVGGDEGRLGKMIKDQLDDFVMSADVGTSSVAKSARKLWQRKMKSDMIEEAIRRAEANPSGMKQGLTVELRKIYNNPKKLVGWTDTEKKVLLDIVTGKKSINALNNLGKFSINLSKNVPHALTGSLGVGTAGGIGYALGGPGGAALAAGGMEVAGTLGRKAADALQLRNANYLASLMRAGMNEKQLKAMTTVLDRIGNNNEAFQSLARAVNAQTVQKTSELFQE